MDSELRDLVDRFRNLQRQEIVTLINERNIVEILNEISRKKKMVELVFTSDGREFLTKDQLKREIVTEVQAQTRLNVVDLPGLINVDMHIIEKAIPDALREGEIVEHQGELMTTVYLDSIVQSAAETLRGNGFLVLASFVKSLQLPSQFVTDILEAAIREGKFRARMDDGVLFTSQFVNAQKKLIRSALLAQTRPVVLGDLMQRHRMTNSLCIELAQQLITAGDVAGSLEGVQFVPQCFTDSRNRQVENLYSSNGVVSYAALSREGVGNPRQFMITKFNPPVAQARETATNKRGKGKKPTPNTPTTSVAATIEYPLAGHALSSCFLADRFLSRLVVPFDLLTNGDSQCIDLSEHFPNDLTWESDVEVLLPRLSELYPIVSDCKLFDTRFLVPAQRLLELLNDRIGSLILDEVRSNGKPKQLSKASVLHKIGLLLQKTLNSTKESEVTEGLLNSLFAEWDDRIEEHIQAAVASLTQSTKFEAKKTRMELSKECSTRWTELQVILRAIKWVDAEIATQDAQGIHKALLQTKCVHLLHVVLQHEAVDHPDVWEKIEKSQLNNSPPVPRQELSFFEKKKQTVLQPLVDGVLNAKTLESALQAFEAGSGDGSISISFFHDLNKKAEREANNFFQAELRAELVKSTFPKENPSLTATTFALCCSVLLCSHYRIYLPAIPGKAVASIVARLAKESSTPSNLTHLKDEVVKSIVSAQVSEQTIADLEDLKAKLLQTCAAE